MEYELVAVTAPGDWAAFHAIRRIELFEAKGRYGVYNANHPDDVADFAHPYLLKVSGKPVGVLRLDILGAGRAAIRLVAITAGEQGRGHGRVMEGLVAEQARHFGIDTLVVNSAPEAVGFYEKTGWQKFVWDAAELIGIAANCVQMKKPI